MRTANARKCGPINRSLTAAQPLHKSQCDKINLSTNSK